MKTKSTTSTILEAIFFASLLFIHGTQSFAPSKFLGSYRRETLSLNAASSTTSSASSPLSLQSQGTRWQWKGHDIFTEIYKSNGNKPPSPAFLFQKSKPSVLLIHGFGCSTTYWRETASALVEEGYQVHALDLLGQGQSAKPGRADGVEYSIHLWAELVDAYIAENMKGEDVILAGNSLGSLVALSAATGDFATIGKNNAADLELAASATARSVVKGICMFNCGVGLNSRGIAKESHRSPAESFFINALLDILDALIFRNMALLGYVLDKVVTRDLLRDTLQNLYKCEPGRVDDELVESFFLPAKDDGSVEALSQIYTNDPGATPMALHDKHSGYLKELPIHLIWGNEDVVTPLEGGVGQFYYNLAAEDKTKVSFDVVQSGHVPFDDNPVDSNRAMLRWLDDVVHKEMRQSNNIFAGLLGQ